MNYFSVNNNNNINNTDELPPLPNINAVRTRMPVFSFGSQERFNFDNYKKNKSKEKKDDNNDKIESDIYFDIDKRKDFSKIQPMSSNLKREMFDMRASAALPGPGLYNFPGFADEIIKKNQRYNNARLTKKEDNNKNKIETKTNTEVNNYMNEFNENINEDDIGELNKINENNNVNNNENEQINENITNQNDEKNINNQVENNTTTKNETE
jgi:hypothetical protein